MFNEFKQFIARGNVIDMAIGIIMGAAFTTIVKSVVDDIIMPVVGILTNGIDFSDLFINLSGKDFETLSAAKAAGAATLNYGTFINAIINFLIVSSVAFLLVKNVNKLRVKETKKEEAEKIISPPQDVILLTEIRDLLAKK